jgi:hypothetical protein
MVSTAEPTSGTKNRVDNEQARDSTNRALPPRSLGRYHPASREPPRFRDCLGTVRAAPLVAEAQQAKRIPRIAFLTTTSPGSSPTTDAFRQGLRELGYVGPAAVTAAVQATKTIPIVAADPASVPHLAISGENHKATGGGLIEFRGHEITSRLAKFRGEAATKFRARLRFSIRICLRIHRSLTDIREGAVWATSWST